MGLPLDTPDATPVVDEIVACVPPIAQDPPDVASASVTVAFTQNGTLPEMAAGSGFTVNDWVTKHPDPIV